MSIRLGVLISGSGTNLQAIIDRIASDTIDASIELVVSSRADAYGLMRAQAAGIQTLTMDKGFYDEEHSADRIIAAEMRSRSVDYILMAGYMRMVHAPLLDAFPNRIVNIHPALLPSFKGAHGIRDAYEYGVKIAGVTVHFADDRYDCGPIIAQRALAVEEGWTLDEFEAHIHEIEHDLYPEVVGLLVAGRVRVTAGGKVEILPT